MRRDSPRVPGRRRSRGDVHGIGEFGDAGCEQDETQQDTDLFDSGDLSATIYTNRQCTAVLQVLGVDGCRSADTSSCPNKSSKQLSYPMARQGSRLNLLGELVQRASEFVRVTEHRQVTRIDGRDVVRSERGHHRLLHG